MSSKENTAPLKILVFSLGLLLLGGIALLFALAYGKMSAPQGAAPVAAQECKGGKLDLRGRGMVMESKREGDILRLMLEKGPGQTQMLSINICTGQVTGELIIESDASLPVE